MRSLAQVAALMCVVGGLLFVVHSENSRAQHIDSVTADRSTGYDEAGLPVLVRRTSDGKVLLDAYASALSVLTFETGATTAVGWHAAQRELVVKIAVCAPVPLLAWSEWNA